MAGQSLRPISRAVACDLCRVISPPSLSIAHAVKSEKKEPAWRNEGPAADTLRKKREVKKKKFPSARLLGVSRAAFRRAAAQRRRRKADHFPSRAFSLLSESTLNANGAQAELVAVLKYSCSITAPTDSQPNYAG